MINKYLEKIANNPKKDNNSNTVAQGVIGLGAISQSRQRLLGYHTIFHGTDKATASTIKEHGFDPKHGGSGAAKIHGSGRFVANSSGKVHVTKNPIIAGFFANYKSKAGGKPSIVKARVSHKMWNKMEVDPDMHSSKANAATTKHKIGPQFVSGGSTSKGASGFMKLHHLKNYYSTRSGAARGLRGLGLLAGGVGLSTSAAKTVSSKYSHEKTSSYLKTLAGSNVAASVAYERKAGKLIRKIHTRLNKISGPVSDAALKTEGKVRAAINKSSRNTTMELGNTIRAHSHLGGIAGAAVGAYHADEGNKTINAVKGGIFGTIAGRMNGVGIGSFRAR